MMTFSQISFTNNTENLAPSWMKMDNFIDYIYPQKLSLYQCLRKFLASLF